MSEISTAVLRMEEHICLVKGDVRVLECALEKVRAEIPDDYDLLALLDHVEHRLLCSILAIEDDWNRALDVCRGGPPDLRVA